MLFLFRLESQRPMLSSTLEGLRGNEVAYCVATVLERTGLLSRADILRTHFGPLFRPRFERIVNDPNFQRAIYRIGQLAVADKPFEGDWCIKYDVKGDLLTLEYVPNDKAIGPTR